MLHRGKLADVNPDENFWEKLWVQLLPATHGQQSKAAHMMNMNQRQANQNHIPYFKVQYVTLNPRLNHVKRAFDNKYILFVIFPNIHAVLVMGLTTFLHG